VDLRGISADLRRAAKATSGEMLWFEGEPAFSVYTRDCGGRTEAAGAVWADVRAPYLISRGDPYCTRHGTDTWSWAARPEQIGDALRQSRLQFPELMQRICIAGRTGSGRARVLELGGPGSTVSISASSFRFAMGRSIGWNTLRSDRYEVAMGGDRIVFHGTGEGHGVGLCQHGADEMGLEGFSYREILAFYYPGTTVSRSGAGLKWIGMGGEGIRVFSTQPDRDGDVLTTAEGLKHGLEEQLHIAAAREIEIRVYPNVDTFRNATAEPGWVAARASGARIDIQPAEVLRRRGIFTETLRHELLHVLIETQAARDVPVWFREGLVEFLDGTKATISPRTALSDRDLEQRSDRLRAQRAYEEANARVTALVTRYGEATVLDWLKRGLPAEVKNSIESSAATKSR
jgi:stage II sporulation protein D